MHRGKKEPGEQIIVMTISEPFDLTNEPSDMIADTIDMLGSITEPFFIIYEIVGKVSVGFKDIVNSWANYRHNQGENEKWEEYNKHSRMSVVGGDELLIRLGVKAGQHLFPDKDITTFDTVEEALNYARTRLAKLKAYP